MENKETVFADGMIFKRPRDGAPEFVKGSMSFKVEEFKSFLDKYNNNGWVNVDLLLSQKGSLYCKLNTWKKEEQSSGLDLGSESTQPENIPF